MELTVNGDKITGLVSSRQIEQSIKSLTGNGDSFVILAQAEQVYIQTSGDPGYGFILEYRDGSEKQHFSCSDSTLTTDQVIRAFQSYLANDDRWKTEFEWQSQAFDYSGDTKEGVKMIVIGGLILAAVAAWKVLFAD